MRKQLEQRIQELKTEFETGQKRLAELESQRASLNETLLRISGAIQVLEEELDKNSQNELVSPDNVDGEPTKKGALQAAFEENKSNK